MDETFESTNPLSIVDCARLAMVSKEVREAVENNECWKDVLDVLEQDFPLVPFYSKEMEKKGMPKPEGLEGTAPNCFPMTGAKSLANRATMSKPGLLSTSSSESPSYSRLR